jgi:hypothetical protein
MENKIIYKALSQSVIVAAVEYQEGWASYIGAVAGENHDLEYWDVVNFGNKITEELAKVIFPEFSNKEYRK